MDEKTLREQIKGELLPVYLLYGEESYLTAQYAHMIADAAVAEDMGGFNMIKFEGDTASAEQIEEAIDALPLMAEKKCVVIRDLDMTVAAIFERLMPLLEEPPETTVTVLMYVQMQPQPTKNEKWKRLLAVCEKQGAVVNFKKKTATELAGALCARAARNNCILSSGNATLLVEVVGEDMLLLGNELDKLCALADGGEITAALIERAATKNLEAKVYELSKAILRRRADEAYGILDILFQQKEEPLGILGALTGTFVDMYRMKTAVAAHVSAQTVKDTFALGYRSSKIYRLQYASQDAARVPLQTLREKLEVLAQADTLLKSSRANPRFVLEQTLAELL